MATGWIEWNGKRYEFTNAPAYSEKNWGGAFPKNGSGSIATALTVNPTSLTAGGRRGSFVVDGICGDGWLALRGKFYEFVPGIQRYTGIFSLGVDGKCKLEIPSLAELTATTDLPGTLRAPTETV